MLSLASGAASLGPIEAVTFDCWNTLLYEGDWSTAHAMRVTALQEASADCGRSVSEREAGTAFDAAWAEHMRLWHEGVATGAEQVARAALRGLGVGASATVLAQLVRRYEVASHSSRVDALEAARDTLAALSRAGVQQALVCDTGLTPGREVRRHLERLGLLELLEVQAFSDEVGVPKPSAAIFRAALEPLGVAADRALHVGDLRRTDVAGARALGMRSVRIRARFDDQTELPDADLVVSSHAELRAALLHPDAR
jgi:putative hydrolase of the HAD superfamily